MENENRKEGQSFMGARWIAFKTCEPDPVPDWHALPLEQAIPFKSSWKSNNDAFSLEIGKDTFTSVKVLPLSEPESPLKTIFGKSLLIL